MTCYQLQPTCIAPGTTACVLPATYALEQSLKLGSRSQRTRRECGDDDDDDEVMFSAADTTSQLEDYDLYEYDTSESSSYDYDFPEIEWLNINTFSRHGNNCNNEESTEMQYTPENGDDVQQLQPHYDVLCFTSLQPATALQQRDFNKMTEQYHLYDDSRCHHNHHGLVRCLSFQNVQNLLLRSDDIKKTRTSPSLRQVRSLDSTTTITTLFDSKMNLH